MKGTSYEKGIALDAFKEMYIDHDGKQETDEGTYRIRRYDYWPADDKNDGPFDEFFDDLETAKLRYIVYVTEQIAETMLLEYVELGIYNDYTGFYEKMFVSHQLHTTVSYGLNPNE